MMPARPEGLQRGLLLLTALVFSAGYASLGLVALLVATVWQAVVSRTIPWNRGPMDRAFLSLGAAFLISGLASPYRATALGSLLLAALSIYISYGSVYRVLRRDPRFLAPFLWTLVVGGIMAAGWGLAISLQTGRLAYLPVLERNSLATTLLIALLLSLRFLATETLMTTVALVAGQAVMALALLRTDSRAAWVALLAGLAVFFGMAGRRHSRRAILILGVLGIVSLAGLGPNRPGLLARFGSIINPAANQNRIILAEAALAIFRDHPLTGTGLNTFTKVQLQYTSRMHPKFRPHSSAHNIFLNMAAEGGILGLVAFAYLVGVIIGVARRWHVVSGSRDDTVTRAAISAALVGVLVDEQFDATIIAVHVAAGAWFLVAVLAAFATSHEAIPSRAMARGRGRPPSVLMVSNGHGEDAVGMALAAKLQPGAAVTAYPLVGIGGAYRGVALLDPRRESPSGGFGLRGRALWADLRAGGVSHWRAQRAALRGQRGRHDLVIAIGDVYCLTMAVRAGAPAVLIATAKSEYNEPHRWVERVLMRRHARIVFARDQATADALRHRGLPARYVGNPLMDTIGLTEPAALADGTKPAVTLLPGSRVDAYANLRPLLRLCEQIAGRLQPTFFCALAPGIDVDRVKAVAAETGWSLSGDALRRDGVTVTLTRAFGNALAAADVVVGLAGTANEQAAGLGKPVVTFPGPGAQITAQFVRLQQLLLGEALVATQDWEDAANAVVKLLQDPAERVKRGQAGRQRMGGPGAVEKIAESILALLEP